MFKKIPGNFWKDSGKCLKDSGELIQQGNNGHEAAFF